MGTNDLPPCVAAYFTLLNADDLGDFADLWVASPRLSVFGRDGRRSLTGRGDVLAWYDGLFAPWSHHHDEVVRAAVAGDTVTAEIVFTGATHDDRPVRFDALDVFRLRDGRIAELAIWHDVLTTRRLLATPTLDERSGHP